MQRPPLLFLLLSAAPLMGQQPQASLGAHWSTNAEFFRGQNGRRVTFVCPGGGSASNVWGAEFYTDDSSVCTAAVHSGVIGFANGGVITVTIAPGRGSYKGSQRNGVTSYDYGAHTGSFTVSPASADGQVDWQTTAKGLATSSLKHLTVICPPGGSSKPVWGSEIYTDDSSICAAAVHAGVITFEQGGPVTLQPAGEQSGFTASTQRGVTTAAYGKYPNSFRVAGAVLAEAKAPQPKPPESRPPQPKAPESPAPSSNAPSASATRMITTAPFKIAGTASGTVRVIHTEPLKLSGSVPGVIRVVKTTPITIVGKTP